MVVDADPDFEGRLEEPGAENAQPRGAKAELETARLNLDLTRIRTSVDGCDLRHRLRQQQVTPSVCILPGLARPPFVS